VVYRAPYNDYFRTDSKIFPSAAFLAELLQHLPDARNRLIRCYGLYSSRARGTWSHAPHLLRLAPEGWRHNHPAQPTVRLGPPDEHQGDRPGFRVAELILPSSLSPGDQSVLPPAMRRSTVCPGLAALPYSALPPRILPLALPLIPAAHLARGPPWQARDLQLPIWPRARYGSCYHSAFRGWRRARLHGTLRQHGETLLNAAHR
jgi:hypothetical protein